MSNTSTIYVQPSRSGKLWYVTLDDASEGVRSVPLTPCDSRAEVVRVIESLRNAAGIAHIPVVEVR